jgi:hypothetical protein
MLRSGRDGLTPGVSTRRGLLALAATCGLCGIAKAAEHLPFEPLKPFHFSTSAPDIIETVTPRAGIPTGIVFGDSIQRLIAAGVIDPGKFRATNKNLPKWVERVLATRSDDPIVFSDQTSPYLVDLLWPIGLANKADFNEESPINTVSIPGFASTGGWTLGKADNGYLCFNSVEVVHMSDREQAMVLDVATHTFRPCCDNSTFFQDCNHGSALLGLLELAASQGATRNGLYGLALIANSYWFPDNYAQTGLYFSHFYHASWRRIPPHLILGSDYSSLSGWEKNVSDRLAAANITLPGQPKGQQAC